MKIVKKGWLHWLYKNGGGHDFLTRDRHTDLCTYMKMAMWGFLKALMLTLAVVFMLLPLLFEPVATLATWVWTGDVHYWVGEWLMDPGAEDIPMFFAIGCAIYMIVMVVFIFAGAMTYIVEPYKVRKRQQRQDGIVSTPGVIGTWLKGLKEKTCILVELVDEDGTKS